MAGAGMGFSEALTVLRIRNYRYFLLSRFFATLAGQMQALIVAWQIYQLTHDPLSLGLVGLVEAAVFMGFILWGGSLADKSEKRALILVTQGLMALCAMAFLFIAGRPEARPLWIYGVIAVTGLARSFMWPASFSYSELTVPRAIYSRAASLNSTAWEVGSIVGPALGGALYAWRGPHVAYGTVLALTFIAIGFSLAMGRRPPAAASHEHASRDLLSGVRFVFSKQPILAAMSLDMFAVFFGGVYAILPIFADRLGVGARGLGWLRAAPSVGAIVSALYQMYRPPYEKTGRSLLIAVACFGSCMIAFAFCHSFLWCLVILALSGIADNVSVIIRASIVQAFTPDAMRGRVASVNGIFIGSSNEIGAFESGAAAKLLGAMPSVLLGGSLTLVTAAAVAIFAPQLRRLGRIND